ncbi:EF-hand domain-containing protein [Polaribacter sp.]|uniref:EF-hand domain-containing protein n=1 Tax=Polaribacter sp. TaxID=1920175 RepID=UPI003F6B88B1
MPWTKEKIIINIESLMKSKFSSPREAFDYFDADKDGNLTKHDLKQILKEAKVNILIRGVVADFMLQSFDENKDGLVSWHEFQAAIKTTNIK